MALTALGFWLDVTIADNSGATTTQRWEMQSIDYAAALVDAGQVIPRIAAVINGVIVSYGISSKWAEDSLTLPGEESQKEAKMLLSGRDETNPLKKHTITIASPDAAVFQETSGPQANIVDLSNADVIAWYGSFTTGGELFISDGEICLDEGSGGLLDGHRATRYARLG